MRSIAPLAPAFLALVLGFGLVTGSAGVAEAEDTAPAAVADANAALSGLSPSVPAPAVLPDPATLARQIEAGERPPTLTRPTDVVVPYGYTTPTLRCTPLRACAVQLEEGETLLDTVTGNSRDWLIDRASLGPGGRTTVLTLKPASCDLATNLLVTTDRRLYQVLLTSPPCPEGPAALSGGAAPLLRYYYPDDLVRHWQDAQDAAEVSAGADAAARLPLAGAVPLTSLNFRYRFEARRFPWKPDLAFDDGVHTYLRIPASARSHPTPALFLLREGGATDLLNYTYRPGPEGSAYFVTDRVLDRAVLVVGSGRSARRLTVTNLALAR